jgi:hypothetical protein
MTGYGYDNDYFPMFMGYDGFSSGVRVKDWSTTLDRCMGYVTFYYTQRFCISTS